MTARILKLIRTAFSSLDLFNNLHPYSTIQIIVKIIHLWIITIRCLLYSDTKPSFKSIKLLIRFGHCYEIQSPNAVEEMMRKPRKHPQATQETPHGREKISLI